MKANKMSKKSTITITVMACLLAVAVATTIVLAAFSASKQATTTITFSSGVQLKITGASQTETNNPDDILSTGPVTLNWNVILTKDATSSTDKTGTVGGDNGLDGSQQVDLAAISMDVAGSGDATIYLAVQPKVTYTGGTPASGTVDFSTLKADGWTAGETDANGTWYLKSVSLTNGAANGVVFTQNATNLYTPATTGTEAEKAAHDNAYASRVYTAQILFEASTVAIHLAAGTP